MNCALKFIVFEDWRVSKVGLPIPPVLLSDEVESVEEFICKFTGQRSTIGGYWSLCESIPFRGYDR